MATNLSQNTSTSPPKPPMSASSTVSAPTSPTPSSSTVSPTVSAASSFTTATTASSDINSTTVPRKTEAPPKQRSKNGYVARVGFDTLDCEDTVQYAFTLQSRTDKWRRTKKTRTFLVGTDLNEYSSHALSWVMENMIEDGDEIVALRVVPIELRDSFAKSGIPSFQGQEFAARTEAAKIMEMIRLKNKSKEINIIVECLVGNVRDTIQNMIQLYEPSMLVVGTKGRSSIKGFLLGSVSRYCLNHSPIPVTVVRPASQLIKSKTKAKGIFRRRTSFQLDPEETDTVPQMFYSSPLSRQTSRASVDSEESRAAMAAMAELERKESRNSDSGHHHHHQYETAAAKASAAKRSSLFSAASTPSSMMMPPNPSASISSSLSFASALLSDDPPSEKKFVPPPEGMIRLTKSLTTDGTTGQSSSGYTKKVSGRRSFAKLSPSSIWGLGSRKKQESREA